MPATPSAPILGRRALNRALLARQGLLERAPLAPIEMVERLVGMQAQDPLAPYTGLWSRLAAFDPAELGRAIEERRAVRVTVMRGTIHLVSARDARRLVPLMRPVARRGWATGSPFGRMAQGLDVDALLAAGRELLEDAPRSTAELRRELALRWPDRDPDGLAMTVRYLLPLAQLPPRGVWGKSGHPRWAPLESWLGEALEPDPSIDDVVLRYLAAFGPASVMDVQAWCWLTRLREVVERLRPGLVTFRDERGRELFDLPDAPRPEAETPAPVRFIPPYDNIALSHDDRARVIAATDRDRLFTHGGVLVEGFVAGAWAIRRGRRAAVLEIEPFRPLEAGEEEAVRAEGGRLLEFAAGGAAERSIELTALPNWHRERRLARASEAADVAG